MGIKSVAPNNTNELSYATSVALASLSGVLSDGATEVVPSAAFTGSADGKTWTREVARTAIADARLWHKLHLRLSGQRTVSGATQYVSDDEYLEVQPLDWPEVFLFVADAKRYLKIEATDTDSDEEIADLIAEASALVAGRIPRLITAAEVAEQVTVSENVGCLNLRNWPVSSIASITDPAGNTVALDYFTVNYASGILKTGWSYEERILLTPGTWTVTYTGGMSADALFATQLEPQIKRAVKATVVDAYENRNDRATQERDGDLSVQRDYEMELPPNAERICRRLAGPVFGR